MFFFFFKQKTAYEMRISDWSSDVCSSDLQLDYFDARAAVDAIKPGAWAKLPYTARVHAENLVRKAEPEKISAYLGQLIERKRDLDFPWFPVRVVCHDILGQTALVDLAGLRDAIADMGGDPAKVTPVVPVQLIVDHSLAVEHGGFEKNAFAKNRAIEDRRNERSEERSGGKECV